jgi:UDP-N-acetylmuramoyl-L-alanyl-D-glutamate--2,6-diaminopimelate ligase
MNDLKLLFEEFNLPTNQIDHLKDVFWQTQNSNKEAILFYKFHSNKNSMEAEKFYDRISTSRFGICICNNPNIKYENTFFVKDKYEEFHQRVLDIVFPLKEKINFYGVTGTNGKTTTVDLARQLLVQKNMKVMTVGTLGIYVGDIKVDDFSLTTPALIDLYKVIYKYRSDIDYILVEMSSHALFQKRFGNIVFQKIAWTNFSQDHLDYHKTMDDYFKAKALIRSYVKKDEAIIIPKSQVSLLKKLSFSPKLVENNLKIENSFFKPNYNLENLSLAIEIIKDITQVNREEVELLKAPPGRFNIIEYKSSFVIIDFAHTPDAVHSIAKEVKSSFPDKGIKIVLGCGGDRDRAKRSLMGKAASKYADFIYLTSDNPRYEDPNQIIQDIVPGVDSKFEIEVDRKKTIIKAMKDLDNDVLLIVGKGHENYLDIQGQKLPYSDIETVQEYMNDKS